MAIRCDKCGQETGYVDWEGDGWMLFHKCSCHRFAYHIDIIPYGPNQLASFSEEETNVLIGTTESFPNE
jgi:hypothetical protein